MEVFRQRVGVRRIQQDFIQAYIGLWRVPADFSRGGLEGVRFRAELEVFRFRAVVKADYHIVDGHCRVVGLAVVVDPGEHDIAHAVVIAFGRAVYGQLGGCPACLPGVLPVCDWHLEPGNRFLRGIHNAHL